MNSVAHEMVRDLHNLMRWLIVFAALRVLVVDYRGWATGRPWTDSARRAGLIFVALLGAQLLIALTLYSVSPLTRSAWANPRAAMWNRELRFFAFEHPFQMVLAMGLATLGTVMSNRAGDDASRYKRAALFYTVSVLLIVTVIPWRFSSHSRPWGPQLRWVAGSR